VLAGNTDPEEILQGQKLDVQGAPAPLVRHARPHRCPLDLFGLRQLSDIMKMAEFDSAAPIITLLYEIMQNPVQDPSLH